MGAASSTSLREPQCSKISMFSGINSHICGSRAESRGHVKTCSFYWTEMTEFLSANIWKNSNPLKKGKHLIKQQTLFTLSSLVCQNFAVYCTYSKKKIKGNSIFSQVIVLQQTEFEHPQGVGDIFLYFCSSLHLCKPSRTCCWDTFLVLPPCFTWRWCVCCDVHGLQLWNLSENQKPYLRRTSNLLPASYMTLSELQMRFSSAFFNSSFSLLLQGKNQFKTSFFGLVYGWLQVLGGPQTSSCLVTVSLWGQQLYADLLLTRTCGMSTRECFLMFCSISWLELSIITAVLGGLFSLLVAALEGTLKNQRLEGCFTLQSPDTHQPLSWSPLHCDTSWTSVNSAHLKFFHLAG